MRYLLVESFNSASFVDSINDLLKKGWVCQGGISTRIDPKLGITGYTQAMTKKGSAEFEGL